VECLVAKDTIVRYVMLGGDVWVYLGNDDVRLATAPEVEKIINDDPDFASQFSVQKANYAPIP
jgi:hypothetical protein